jgi:hypothetical protein
MTTQQSLKVGYQNYRSHLHHREHGAATLAGRGFVRGRGGSWGRACCPSGGERHRFGSTTSDTAAVSSSDDGGISRSICRSITSYRRINRRSRDTAGEGALPAGYRFALSADSVRRNRRSAVSARIGRIGPPADASSRARTRGRLPRLRRRLDLGDPIQIATARPLTGQPLTGQPLTRRAK